MWRDVWCNKTSLERNKRIVRRILESEDFLAIFPLYLSTVKKAAKFAVKVANIKTMNSQ